MSPLEPREMTLIDYYKEQHQAVARMLASGMTESMVRQRTGYSTRRLTLLQADPTFNELIAVFRKRIEEKWEANLDTYIDLGMANMIRSEAQIAEHLDKSEDTGELLPVATLDRISQGRADRFGYSKHATIHHQHDFATAMDKAIARSNAAKPVSQVDSSPPVIEVQASSPSPDDRMLAISEEQARPPDQRTRPAPRSFAGVLAPIKRRRVA